MNPSITQRSATRRSLLAGAAIVAAAVSLSALNAHDAVSAAANDDRAAQLAAGNWNFEKGDLTGWQTRSSGSGTWYVYADGTKPPNPAETDPFFPFKVPQPPEGQYAAVTDMTAPGARILYRDVKLDRRVKLRLTLYYENHVGEFFSPARLDHEMHRPNQQLRVDIMDPAAPVASTAAKHVLASIFHTAPGDPAKVDPRAVTADLSRWAGKKIRIRVAQVDNIGPFRAGVDDVRLKAAD